MVCSNVSPESLGGIDRAAADFHALGERAAKRGLRVGFEALAWGRHINDYRDAWEVVRRADHPAIGLVLDTFHICARKTDLKPLHAIPSDRIFLVQLADAPWLDMDVLSWSRHFRCFPGQGDLPLLEFMEALLVTGYDGEFSLEIFNDQFRAGSPRAVAIDGQRSLIYLHGPTAREKRRRLARHSGDAAAVEMPRRRVHRVRRRRPHRRRAGAVHFRSRLSQSGAAQVEGGDALDARRRSIWSSTRRRKASPIRTTSPTGLRSAPSA